MPPRKVLIQKCSTINWIPSRSTSTCDISALYDEVIHDSVKFTVEVVQSNIDSRWLSVLARAQASEILYSFGREVRKQFKDDTASLRGPDLHIHIDFRVGLVTHLF